MCGPKFTNTSVGMGFTVAFSTAGLVAFVHGAAPVVGFTVQTGCCIVPAALSMEVDEANSAPAIHCHVR